MPSGPSAPRRAAHASHAQAPAIGRPAGTHGSPSRASQPIPTGTSKKRAIVSGSQWPRASVAEVVQRAPSHAARAGVVEAHTKKSGASTPSATPGRWKGGKASAYAAPEATTSSSLNEGKVGRTGGQSGGSGSTGTAQRTTPTSLATAAPPGDELLHRGGRRRSLGLAQAPIELPALHPADGEHVGEADEESVRDPVLGAAVAARPMAHGELDDPCAFHAQQGRQEAVHAAVELHPLQVGGPHHPQRAADVADRLVCRPVAEAVADARRQLSHEGVPASDADAVREVGVLERGEELREVRGIVLEVGVEGRHELAPSRLEACRERRGLAAVLGEAQHAHAVISLRERAQHGGAVVTAPVVHVHELDATRKARERRVELAVERLQVVPLVEDRDDHREAGRRQAPPRSSSGLRAATMRRIPSRQCTRLGPSFASRRDTSSGSGSSVASVAWSLASSPVNSPRYPHQASIEVSSLPAQFTIVAGTLASARRPSTWRT